MAELDYTFLPVTDFRSKAKETLEVLRSHPVILTQRGRPSAVLVDYDQYRALQAQIEDLELSIDSLLLERAQATAEEFITLDELFADYEATTGTQIPPAED